MSENWSDDDDGGSSNQPQQNAGFHNNYNNDSSRNSYNSSYPADNFTNSNNKRGRGNFKSDFNRRGYDRDDSSRRDFKKGSTNSQEEKCTFYIETSKLGKIIGRGGSKIREIQDQSGANLQVSNSFSNMNFIYNFIR